MVNGQSSMAGNACDGSGIKAAGKEMQCDGQLRC
jgi:hypothetical protein